MKVHSFCVVLLIFACATGNTQEVKRQEQVQLLEKVVETQELLLRRITANGEILNELRDRQQKIALEINNLDQHYQVVSQAISKPPVNPIVLDSISNSLADTAGYLKSHSSLYVEHQRGLEDISTTLSQIAIDNSKNLQQFANLQKSTATNFEAIEGLKLTSSQTGSKIEALHREVGTLKGSIKKTEEQTTQAVKTLEQVSKTQEEILQRVQATTLTSTVTRAFTKLKNSTRRVFTKGWTAIQGLVTGKSAKGVTYENLSAQFGSLVVTGKGYFHALQTLIAAQVTALQVPKQYVDLVSLILTGIATLLALLIALRIIQYLFVLISFCCACCGSRRPQVDEDEDPEDEDEDAHADGKVDETPPEKKKKYRGPKKPKTPTHVK